MTMSLQQLLTLFVALFTLYSPLSNIGPYASLVGHLSRPDQKKLAFAVFINVLVVLLLSAWVGEVLFDVLGVNESSLSVTGGIALMIGSLPMMLGTDKPEEAEPGEVTQNWRDMALTPMTFPLSIDGTFAAYVISATALSQNVIDLVAISIVVLLFGVVVWLTLYFSPPLVARSSPRVGVILSRVGGIVLVAISVQLIADGVKGLFPFLGG